MSEGRPSDDALDALVALPFAVAMRSVPAVGVVGGKLRPVPVPGAGPCAQEGGTVSSPTQRALRECEKRGWLACVVEKWLPRARVRQDAFGFGDLLAVTDDSGACLIQVTTTGNAPARVKKIREQCGEAAARWVAAGNTIRVWGYAKRGAAGKRKLWTLKEYEVPLD